MTFGDSVLIYKYMDNEILKQLNDNDKIFLEDVNRKIAGNTEKLHSVCNFVIDRVGRDNLSDLAEINSEEKLQICLDHLAISLVSGDLKKKDIEELL